MGRKRQINPRYQRTKKTAGNNISAERSDICYDRMILFGCHIDFFKFGSRVSAKNDWKGR